jgi:HK97 family phage portal protein
MKFPNPFRREVKESAAARTMVLTPGQPAWTPRDYRSFAVEGYQKNVIGYQAINRVADAVASVRWTAWRGETELTEHPILTLLDRPNPLQSGKELIRAKVGFLLISGNCYDERVTVGGQPRELYTLRPDRMKVIEGETGIPAGYVYEVGGRKARWDMDPRTLQCDIRHGKLFNPVNDWYGMAPIEAGAFAIDQHNLSMAWMQSLLQNSARPSGALVTKDATTVSDEQYNRLKTELEDQYSGARNAGRPMLLEGGLTWQQMGLSPTDMGIIEGKYSSARDVALAFGVPPQLLGIPGDNTYCLPFSSRVSTPSGPVKIGEVRPGDTVYSMSGGAVVERRVLWQGMVGTKQTYRVKLTNRDIVATGNHPIMVRRDTGDGECALLYVAVENLQPGDIAVIAHALPETARDGDITPHQMELYGFYTGDGSSALPVAQGENRGYRRGGFVSLAIPIGASYRDHYATILGNEGGNPVIEYDRTITVPSSDLARRLHDLGLTGTAHTKRVPAWVFGTSKTMKLAYLRGILDSDGSVDKCGRMTLALCNADLVADIWHLALSCSLRVGRIWSRNITTTLPNGQPHDGEMHGFMISEPESVAMIGTRTPEYVARIGANMGKSKFAQHWYSTGGARHDAAIRECVDTDYISYARVIDILPEGEQDVYDIEVEEDHNFIADGVIVHNSNYAEARLAFWEDTVIPLIDMFAADWSQWLGNGEVELRPDLDQIPAIAEKRQSLWDMADKATDLTINERRELKGYGPTSGGDVLFVASSQIPIAVASDDGTDVDPVAGGIPVADVQQSVLNGAQIASLQQIVQAVADGTLPQEAAIELVAISFPSISRDRIVAMINPAANFTPEPQGVPPELTPSDVKAWVYGAQAN